jgi:large subunit ribosomal protein L18
MSRNNSRIKRHRRIRSKVSGTPNRPRLMVYRSLTNLYVQLIDDSEGKTLVAADLREVVKKKEFKNDVENAKKLGALVADKCKKAKISEVVFDRGGYSYHGRVVALADGVREGGVKF